MGELIKLVKAYQRSHDPEVGDSIVREINPTLRLFLECRVPKEIDLVDDLLQTTLVGIFLRLKSFKGNSDAQFYGFCYTVARRRVIDLWRKRGREPKFVFPEDEFWEAIEQPKPPLTKREREQLESVMELLAAVRPPCVSYLLARHVIGMTYTEMRKAFNFPSTAAAGVATRRCLQLAKNLAGK